MDFQSGVYSTEPFGQQSGQEVSQQWLSGLSRGLAERLPPSDHCTSLDLSHLPVTNQDLKLIVSYFSNVKECSLAASLITDLTPLSRWVSLRKLAIPFCQKLTAEAFRDGLAELPQLTYLDVSGCRGFNYKAAKGLTHCSELIHCDLSDCTNFTEKGLDFLPVKLQFLSLKGLPKLTGKVWDHLLRFRTLTSLDLSQTSILYDRLNLLNSLPLLDTLYLWQCRNLLDDDLIWLKERRMQRVDLSFCTQLTDACNLYLTNIAELSLDGCQYLSTEGLALLQNSSRLTQFSVTRCPAILPTIKE